MIYQVNADDGVDKYIWLFSAKNNDEACQKALQNLVECFEEMKEWTNKFATKFVTENFSITSCKFDNKW